ncbi:hypothetical protein [Oceanospirillum sp.]|uniref:hypothetical protein n=1 Tax=Oceanospirillum sp. TaxID=2021254 RepID=UPI003A921197
MYRLSAILLTLLMLSGCVGYIGGDLENIETEHFVPYCWSDPKRYQLKVDTDAPYDYASENPSGYIASWTLGVIPTYWLDFEESRIEIIDTESGSASLYQREDRSRIHKFYGLLWMLVLPENSDDAIPSDEGAGMRVPEAIRSRSVAKTLNLLPDEIDRKQLCVQSAEHS